MIMTVNRQKKKVKASKKKPEAKKQKPRYTKDNPHPKHIEDPEHFTYWGTPRCQGRNPRTGKQCTKGATVDGKFCAVHTDIEEAAAKGGYHMFDEVSDKIIAFVRQGYTFTTASARVGLNPRTITEWRRRGKEEMARGQEGKYAKFWCELEEARIFACSLVENALFSAAINGNVSAMIRYLECRMPDVWNAKRVMEISVETKHKLDVNYQIDVKSLTDEQLRAKVKEIAEAVDVTVGKNVDQAALPPIPVQDAEVTDA